VIRGIVLPTTASGVGAAIVLALGRALGEAIAVLFVVGHITQVTANLFQPGSTIASLVADQFQNTTTNMHVAALFYAALVLVAIGLMSSLAARTIAGRFDVSRALAR
jgi:phosphate transport system permease protein